MSKGVPLSEPLSGLVVYVYLGQPLVPRWQSLPPRCAARREKSARWESCTTPPRQIPQPLQHHLFWEKLAPIRQHECPAQWVASMAERSVTSNRGVVGGFRVTCPENPFLAPIFGSRSSFLIFERCLRAIACFNTVSHQFTTASGYEHRCDEWRPNNNATRSSTSPPARRRYAGSTTAPPETSRPWPRRARRRTAHVLVEARARCSRTAASRRRGTTRSSRRRRSPRAGL